MEAKGAVALEEAEQRFEQQLGESRAESAQQLAECEQQLGARLQVGDEARERKTWVCKAGSVCTATARHTTLMLFNGYA